MASKFGWAYVDCGVLLSASGPTGSVQFRVTDPGDDMTAISGSRHFMFFTKSNAVGVGLDGNDKPNDGFVLQVNGNTAITGNLDVSGTIKSYKFETITVSNTTYEGATSWGNSPDDTHKFTGHVSGAGPAVFGSLIISGYKTATGVATAGNLDVSGALDVVGATTLDGNVTLGNAAGDVITSTGIFNSTANAKFTGSVGVSADLTVGDQLKVGGDTILGNATSDWVMITGSVGMSGSSFEIESDASGENKPEIRLTNHHAGSDDAHINFRKFSASPADGDLLGHIDFYGRDDAMNTHEFGNLYVTSEKIANGSERGSMVFSVTDASSAPGNDVSQYLSLDGNRRSVVVGPSSVMLEVSGNAGISGSLYVWGETKISGNVGLGNADSDIVTVNGQLTASAGIIGNETSYFKHVLPRDDNTWDLGTSGRRWANIYTADLNLKNERGDWTVIEEENYLTVRNNKTGKRFKLLMEEIED